MKLKDKGTTMSRIAKLTALLCVLLVPVVGQASRRAQNLCTPLVHGLEDSDLTSSRSFTTSRTDADKSAYNILTVYVNHDDSANGSVTRFDMTAVAVIDDLTTADTTDTAEYILQSCAVSAGACTSSDVDWQKTVSGSEDKKIVWRIDVAGVQDIKVTFDAGAGSGHADDRFDAFYQYCLN